MNGRNKKEIIIDNYKTKFIYECANYYNLQRTPESLIESTGVENLIWE